MQHYVTHNFRADARAILAVAARYGIPIPPMEPEHRLLQSIVRHGDVALDIGANVGAYTLQLSRLVGSLGRVIAVEPYGPSARRLRLLARAFRSKNIELLENPVWNESSKIRLSTAQPARGGALDGFVHVVSQDEPRPTSVQATTIDELAATRLIPRIDFIKCDVEGAEWMVLAGGAKVISRDLPMLLLETEDRWATRYGHSRRDVLDLVSTYGSYSFFVYSGGSLRSADESVGKTNNVVAIPASRRRRVSHLLPSVRDL